MFPLTSALGCVSARSFMAPLAAVLRLRLLAAVGSSEGYRMVLARLGSREGGTISAAATGALDGLGGAADGLGGAADGLGGAAEGRAPALRVLSRSPLGV